jgi:hypothetical protein
MENKIRNLKDIKTGDNLLVSGKKWLAKTIQKFEGCHWNHSAMLWWNYDELFVIEADSRGICLTPFSEYINGKADLMILKPKFLVNGSDYGKFMLPFAGHTRYGYGNLLLAQSIRYLTGSRLWLGPNDPEDDPKAFICGQWVAYVYYHMTNKEVFYDWPRIAPADIYNRPEFDHYIFEKWPTDRCG